MKIFAPTFRPAELARLRGHRGGIIPMHRALTSLHYGFRELAGSVAIVAIMTLGWLKALPYVCRLWARLFALGLRTLPLKAELTLTPYTWSIFHCDVPSLRMESILPSSAVWGTTCLITIAGFAFTFILPDRLIPVVYILRGVLFLQFSALVYFAVFPAQFVHTPSSYLQGLITSGIAVIALVPALLCFVYYVFPFSLIKKTFLTLITMCHLIVFAPLQVLLHALVLQTSVLFMPVIYLVLGMTLDVYIIVALYSWGMTWKFKGESS